MTVNILNLTGSLTRAWCAATSYDPAGWTKDNAAYGQCAVTACIVQDYLGGDIVWGEVEMPDGARISHFFNRIDGIKLDLTASQFPPAARLPAGEAYPGPQEARAHILSYPETRARYEALAARVIVGLRGVL